MQRPDKANATWHRRAARWLIAALLLAASTAAARPGEVLIDLSPQGLRNNFSPEAALGAGLDGSGAGETDRLFTTRNVALMRSAGLRPLTYRLRTELGIEAWHWGEEGTWSDPVRSQGYWVTSDHPTHPILTSWGYQLPRRGDTIDQANNTGYSRLVDGDRGTFWKSNPYLDPRYTGEAEARPQWFIIELDHEAVVDTAEIAWGEPYATRYEVQYWAGVDEYDPAGRWITFPQGAVDGGQGGDVRLKLGPSRVATRFIRVLLEAGSGAAPAGSSDVRDGIGFAVREAGFGQTDGKGAFHDLVQHRAAHDGQSIAHVSSTDPWHRAVDRDPQLEQPGFDRVFKSGLTNGLPMMAPAGVLYDTPENAAAEIRFLKRRGYRVAQVELGEEPDGQYVDARDYGALYLETAKAIHAVDPGLVVGGPSLQSGFSDTWLDPDPDRSWTSHLIKYLVARGRLAELGFFSFEHYPFDDICGDIHARLLRQSRMMAQLVARLRAEGVPSAIPWIITEYGFSAYSGRAEVEMPSALLMANIVGQFLTLGGDGAYMFGYGPNYPVNQHLACAGYGNMMLFTADADGQAKAPMPVYRAAKLISQVWLEPGRGTHRLYAARAQADETGEAETLKAFAVARPDHRLGVLIINRDSERAFTVKLATIHSAGGAGRSLGGRAEITQYSAADYEWIDAGEQGHPGRNRPPNRRVVARFDGAVTLPPDSLTIVVAPWPGAMRRPVSGRRAGVRR